MGALSVGCWPAFPSVLLSRDGMNALQFLESLSTLNLVANPEVTRLRETLGPEKLTAAADTIARELVDKGLLTRYQAQNIYKGRGKGLLFGEYLVLDKLGAGGMGQVYKAQHRRMKRVVALKVLPPQATNSDAMVKRFYQEVELAARLVHPNIVTAYDAGEAHGLHYLVMEYVEGRDLSYVLTKQGPLAVEPAMRCVLQAARGLEYAHAQGIIHRDIKPANLLVNRLSIVKILDMGLARLQGTLGAQDDGKGLTEAGQVMGTVDYMAPEQAHDTRSADHRADVYSLGCTMYRLITDRIPYEGDTLLKKILAHREQPVPSLRAVRPEVPYALDQLLQRMLMKDPNQRISSMGEVATALDRLLAGKTDEESSLNVTDYIPPLEEGRSFLGGSTVGRTPGSTIGKSASSATVGTASSSTSLPDAIAYVQAMPERTSRLPLFGGIAAALVIALTAAAFIMLRSTSDEKSVVQVPELATVIPSKTSAAAAPTPEAKASVAQVNSALPVTAEPAKIASASSPASPPEKTDEPTVVASATPSTPPPIAPPPTLIVAEPLTATVDLLERIDPSRDAVGEWKKEDGVLVIRKPSKPDDRIVVPYIPPADYDLTIAFEGELAQIETRIGLTIGGYATVFNFTGRSPVALMTLDCKDPTHLSMRPILDSRTNASNPTLVCAVRGSRLYVTVDNKPAFDWSGDPKSLLLPQHKVTLQPKCLSLGCGGSQGSMRFTKIEIAPPSITLPTFKTVDLLASIDVRRDKVTGNPRSEQGNLVIPATNDSSGARIAFNVPRPTEYVVTAVVERITGRGELIAGLPVGDHRGAMVIDLGSDSWVNASQKKLRGETLLTPWRLHTVTYRITHRDPTLVVDGSVVVGGPHWGKDVSLYSSAEVPDPAAFTFYVTGSSGFRIHALELAEARDGERLRLPRPTDEAIAAAREAFSSEMTVAESRTATADLKTMTAESMWRKSAAASSDAEHYARLETAARLAAQAGNVTLACHAGTGLDRTFDGDCDDLYKAVVGDVIKSAKTPTARQALLPDLMRQMDRAVALDALALALELHAAVTTLAKPATGDLSKELKARGVELRYMQSQREAWQQLSAMPGGDPAMVQRAEGKYLGLARGDWAAAVPLLEQSSDPTLAALGRGELARARGSGEMIAQADRWWALFEQSEVPLKYLAMENALAGYRRAAFATVDPKVRSMLEQRRLTVIQQRRASGLAFAPRHPIDARRIGDHWYKHYDSNVAWKIAAQFCADLGGNLLTIETPQENDAITQMLLAASADQRGSCWLGCSDEEKEGDWRWLDGTPVGRPGTFVNWGNGQPDNSGGKENVAALEAQLINARPAGPWSDRAITVSLPFICEWEQ